jgi:UDP-glucose 4-epimerase
MMERNVLVTGASTPIGEELILRLLDDSRVGRILAAADPGSPLTLPDSPRLTKVTVDFRKQRRLHTLLFGLAKELDITVVVHASQSESAVKEGASVHAHNVESLRSIIDFAERHPSIRRLIIRSAIEVYQVQRDLPVLIAEDHPLNMSSGSPQWIRDRVEADFTACARMGLSSLSIIVLRMAEVLSPGCGSQIFDYLQSPVCMRPIGFDPMLNLLTIEDASVAFQKAIHSDAQGVFNIPGADSMPLTQTILRWGRLSIPLTEGAMFLTYRLRRRFRGGEFRYGMNRRRFHYSGVLDGRRASEVLRYVPSHPINWPIAASE